MCLFTEPTPTLFIDWFHPDPTFTLFWVLAGGVVFGLLLTVVWASPDGKDTWLSRKQAALLMLGAYVCMMLVFYWWGVLAPYGNVLDAWYQREQGLLSQECVSTVLTPAYESARQTLKARTDSVVVVLLVLGGLFWGVAAFSRNLIYPSKLRLAKRLNRHIF